MNCGIKLDAMRQVPQEEQKLRRPCLPVNMLLHSINEGGFCNLQPTVYVSSFLFSQQASRCPTYLSSYNNITIGSTAGSNYFVRILSTLDREVLKANTSVALHRHSHSVVEILPPESDSTIQLMQERPDISYHDIGGMDMQKQEVR